MKLNKPIIFLAFVLTACSSNEPAFNAGSSNQEGGNSEVAESADSMVQSADPVADAPESASVQLIDMDDLRLDMESLNGKEIRVRAKGQYMMDMFMLTKNDTDMNPMVVDISGLERNDRKDILENCSDIMRKCNITVQGEVGSVYYQNGLIAKKIEW